jgi:surface antigen
MRQNNNLERQSESIRSENALALRIGLSCALISLFLSVGGCSMRLPGLVPGDEDPAVTGSLAATPLEEEASLAFLLPEDRPHALMAFNAALDPHGSSVAQLWQNPLNTHSGRFVATGAPFLRKDRICRPLLIGVRQKNNEQTRQAIACRLSGEGWELHRVR